MEPQIPDKLYFKIGEVAELTGVKPHVLRYWETEIAAIRPTKSRTQQRLYRHQDIRLILQLKELLYTQGYTIAGARKLLRRKSVAARPESLVPPPAELTLPAVAETSIEPCGQLALPLGSGVDRRLLAELRQDVMRLRESLTLSPQVPQLTRP